MIADVYVYAVRPHTFALTHTRANCTLNNRRSALRATRRTRPRLRARRCCLRPRCWRAATASTTPRLVMCDLSCPEAYVLGFALCGTVLLE